MRFNAELIIIAVTNLINPQVDFHCNHDFRSNPSFYDYDDLKTNENIDGFSSNNQNLLRI